jgi:hypothetical protein
MLLLPLMLARHHAPIPQAILTDKTETGGLLAGPVENQFVGIDALLQSAMFPEIAWQALHVLFPFAIQF